MREHVNASGFLTAGTNAAEMARRLLHPELKGLHAGGIALTPMTVDQPASPPEFDWAILAKERARRDAESRARAAAAEAEWLEQWQRAVSQMEQLTAEAESSVRVFDWL